MKLSHLYRFGVLISVAPLLAFVVPAQGLIPASAYLLHVTVVDSANRGLPSAEIRVDDTVAGVTDDTGQYYMARRPIPEGPHTISVSRRGFTIASRTVRDLARVMHSPSAGVDLRFKLTPAVPEASLTSVTRGAAPRPNYASFKSFM
jgi:hypothetical protein